MSATIAFLPMQDGLAGKWKGMECPACRSLIPLDGGRGVDHALPSSDGSWSKATLCRVGTPGGATEPLDGSGGAWSIITAHGATLGFFATRAEAAASPGATKVDAQSDARRVYRVDRQPLSSEKAHVDEHGFLQIPSSPLARVGIQTYKAADGRDVRELRKKEDVAASAADFAQKPLTNTHPDRLLDASTVKQHAVGAVGPAEFDGSWVRAPLSVWAQDCQDAISAGRRQLSAGYSCELAPRDDAAVAEYGEHDFVQRNIRVNHLAVVDVARAGAKAALKLDSAGNQQTEMEDSDMSDERFQRAVHQRAQLLQQVVEILGRNERVDGVADDDLRKAVLAKLAPAVRVDGAAEIRAAFNTAVAMAPARMDAAAAARAAMSPGNYAHVDAFGFPLGGHPNDARQRMIDHVVGYGRSDDNTPALHPQDPHEARARMIERYRLPGLRQGDPRRERLLQKLRDSGFGKKGGGK